MLINALKKQKFVVISTTSILMIKKTKKKELE